MDAEVEAMIKAEVAAAKKELMENMATLVAHPLQSGGEPEMLAMLDDMRTSIARLLTPLVGQSFLVFVKEEGSGDNRKLVFKRRYLTMAEGGKMIFSDKIDNVEVNAAGGGDISGFNNVNVVTDVYWDSNNKKIAVDRATITVANNAVTVTPMQNVPGVPTTPLSSLSS